MLSFTLTIEPVWGAVESCPPSQVSKVRITPCYKNERRAPLRGTLSYAFALKKCGKSDSQWRSYYVAEYAGENARRD